MKYEKMKKYIFVGILIFSLFSANAFGQAKKSVNDSDDTENEKHRIIDITLKLGSNTYINYLNPETKKIAAPSPIVFMPSIGLNFPNNTLVSFAPLVSIYYSYYQLANGIAIPAEIENRTATTVSVLFDAPISFSFFFNKSKLQTSIGPAALLRFAYLARGVNENDSGFSGTAAEDVTQIKSFFWSKARFIYVSTGISWSYNVYRNTKIGPFATVYVPIGSLIASEGINGMMASLGLKVSF